MNTTRLLAAAGLLAMASLGRDPFQLGVERRSLLLVLFHEDHGHLVILCLGEILLRRTYCNDGRAIDLLALKLVDSRTRVTIEVIEQPVLGAQNDLPRRQVLLQDDVLDPRDLLEVLRTVIVLERVCGHSDILC